MLDSRLHIYHDIFYRASETQLLPKMSWINVNCHRYRTSGKLGHVTLHGDNFVVIGQVVVVVLYEVLHLVHHFV